MIKSRDRKSKLIRTPSCLLFTKMCTKNVYGTGPLLVTIITTTKLPAENDDHVDKRPSIANFYQKQITRVIL